MSLVCVAEGAAEGVLHLQVLGGQVSIGVHSSGSHEGKEAVQGGVGCCLRLQMLSTICSQDLNLNWYKLPKPCQPGDRPLLLWLLCTHCYYGYYASGCELMLTSMQCSQEVIKDLQPLSFLSQVHVHGLNAFSTPFTF